MLQTKLARNGTKMSLQNMPFDLKMLPSNTNLSHKLVTQTDKGQMKLDSLVVKNLSTKLQKNWKTDKKIEIELLKFKTRVQFV